MKRILSIFAILTSVQLEAHEVDTVLPGRNSIFWHAIELGIQSAGEQLTVDVKIRGPSDETTTSKDQEMQKTMIENFITSGANAIILAPAPLTTKPLTKIRFKVPIILLDRPSDDYDAVTLVATDNLEAGRQAFDCIAKKIAPKTTIAVFRLDPLITSTTLRERGFIERAKTKNLSIALDKVIGPKYREAIDNAFDALMKSPIHIELVFTPNEVAAFSTLKAIERMPPDRRPKHVIGFDYREEFHTAILRSKMDATIVQDAFEMGRRSVIEAHDILTKATTPPTFITIPTFCVTKENINAPDIVKKLQQYK